MKTPQLSVREARRKLSQVMKAAQTVCIVDKGRYAIRAILVSVPDYNPWDARAKRKALRAAKKAFLEALPTE